MQTLYPEATQETRDWIVDDAASVRDTLAGLTKPASYKDVVYSTGSGVLSGQEELTTVAGIIALHWIALLRAVFRWLSLGFGLGRGLFRLLAVGFALPIAVADAAHTRWTTRPTAAAIARSRARWLHRWSHVMCWIFGFRIDRRGFVPPSGLVIVNRMSVIDALVLSSIATAASHRIVCSSRGNGIPRPRPAVRLVARQLHDRTRAGPVPACRDLLRCRPSLRDHLGALSVRSLSISGRFAMFAHCGGCQLSRFDAHGGG